MSGPLFLAPWLIGGIALGAVYLLLLRHSVRALRAGGGNVAVWGALALRLGLAVVLFVLAAQQGTGQLLLALAGFILARTVLMKRIRVE